MIHRSTRIERGSAFRDWNFANGLLAICANMQTDQLGPHEAFITRRLAD
jgi:hypothetical protein